VVGIDDELDRVAPVVRAVARRRRIRIAPARRIGIVQPVQPSVGEDEIRVAVEAQEVSGNVADPVADAPVVEDAALGADVVAEQDLVRAEPQREQQLPPQRTERNPARTAVTRELGLVSPRIVELVGVGPDDDVIVGQPAPRRRGRRS
jgi:hypothetical protein